jgi:PKD repeat protein
MTDPLARFLPESVVWQIETVDDSPNNVGRHTSLALDTSGRPHVSYRDDTDTALKYAYYVGAGGNCGPASDWQCDTVDSSGNVGRATSLALDAAGNPHISYYNITNADLKYAYYVGAGGNCGPASDWQCDTVDSSGNVGRYSSLALDTSGQPHISYRDSTNNDLKYAHYIGAGGNCGPASDWQCDAIDSTGDVGQDSSLALDAADFPHIAYRDATNADLKYAYYVGAGGNCGPSTDWQCDAVENVTDTPPPDTSLALDTSGQPHISYRDSINGDLRYAYYVAAGGNCGPASDWQCDAVDSTGDVGQDSSLALDADDLPHIGYRDDTNTALKYAYYVGAGGNCGPASDWRCDTVDSAGDVGLAASLVLDAVDLPHIAYHDASNGNLKYAALCAEVEDVQVTGPGSLLVGEEGIYAGTYLPPTATLPVSLSWDNGTVGPTAAYSWTMPGVYTITVTATNDCAEVTGTQVVQVCQPVESAEVSGPAWLLVGEEGVYAATYLPLTATLPVTFTWHNGTVGPTAAYSWTMPGSYTVTVTATNPCGEVTGTQVVQVCQPVESAEVSGPTVLPVGETGIYTATYLPLTATLPVTFTWDNGTVGPTAAYSWTMPGSYTVTVTATNPCGEASDALVVQVVAVCQAVQEVTIAGPVSLLVGETGLYTATHLPPTATLPVTFTWDGGSVGPTATYSWSLPGVYTITVTATNPCGEASDTLVVLVTSECQPVEEVAIGGPMALLVGETGVYTAAYAPPTATYPVTLTWDSGMEGPTAAYSWTEPGAYTVTITATNRCGQARGALPVTVCRPVSGVRLDWSPVTPTVGEAVAFTGTATSTVPISYSWALGDGSRGWGPTVTHSYAAAGLYTVTLTATNGCDEDVATGTLGVVALRPRTIYLPIVLKGFPLCFEGPWEVEDNDSASQANGLLCSGQEYYAYPDDANDYFSLHSGAGTVTVDMWDYVPGTNGQLILYDEELNWVDWDNDPLDGWQIVADVGQGKYYVRVYTADGFVAEAYRLQVSFPAP